MLSLWCSKKEFMTAPSCRAAAGIVAAISASQTGPSPTLRRGGYQGQSPWLVSARPYQSNIALSAVLSCPTIYFERASRFRFDLLRALSNRVFPTCGRSLLPTRQLRHQRLQPTRMGGIRFGPLLSLPFWVLKVLMAHEV